MATRDDVRRRMQEDGIDFLLVQFVDMGGSPKVKMVPVSHFDDVIDDGAGFAGAAVLGLGQGPHSHDMLARIDLDTYTPLPWRTDIARFASDQTTPVQIHTRWVLGCGFSVRQRFTVGTRVGDGAVPSHSKLRLLSDHHIERGDKG